MRTLNRRRSSHLALLILLCVGIAFGPLAAVIAAEAPQNLDDLVAVYGVGQVPADLLVVVDTSSSMSTDGRPPPWPSVVRGYDALVDAVGPSDRLGLITFDSSAAIRLDPTSLTSDKDRAMARRQLPKRADGQATDIGAALETAVGRLSRGGAAEIQTLVFITDGRHQPPANSRFPTTSSSRWGVLEKRAKVLSESHRGKLNVYGWETGGNGDTDVALVKNVFPDAQILAIPSNQMAGFLSSLATDAQRARVRPAVREDLSEAVTSELITPSRLSSDMEATLRLTNPRRALPTQVDLRGLTVTESDGTPVPVTLEPQTLTLAPGESQDVPVSLSPAGTDHGVITLGERVDSRKWDVQVEATTSLNEALTTLLVTEQLVTERQTRGAVTSPGEIDASSTYGIPWSTFLVLLALLVAAVIGLLLFLKWLFIPPPLSGQLVDADGQLLLRLSGRELVIPNAAVGNSDAGDSVKLFTKPRNVGRRVWIQRISGNPRHNGTVLGRAAKRLFWQDRIVLGSDQIMYRARDTK